ncbi:hypothetical protein [Brevibacillus choshinensis]|uniref:hypothetical protein n=1 Tax=Brevibacillus choshinensis TaxID=54911 RepID=UPI000AC5842F|nr:hypothetical protein [Brevibacillus choshinensis]
MGFYDAYVWILQIYTLLLLTDIEAFMDGKDAFVKELERKALDWHKMGKKRLN